jgi:hypothetical protein
MNKYYVRIGELTLERISEDFIVYTKDTIDELENNSLFLSVVDEKIYDMFYEYNEDEEDWEEFQDSMGIIEIDNWKEEYEDYTSEILYDERNE